MRKHQLELLEPRRVLTTSTVYAVESLPIEGHEPVLYRVEDLNGDGLVDVSILNQSGITWFAQSADRTTFQHRQTIDVQANHFDLIDLNNDARLDLVYTTAGIGVRFRLNSEQDGFADASREIASAPDAGKLVAADVDSDGDNDLLVPRGNGTILHLENQQGSFSLKQQFRGISEELGEIVVGDLDADGALDLLVTSAAGSAWYKNVDGLFDDAGKEISTDAASSPSLADIDGDGDLDVVMRRVTANEAALVWLENSGAAFDLEHIIRPEQNTEGASVAFVGDVNHDGNTDIVSFHPSDDLEHTSIMVYSANYAGTLHGRQLTGTDVQLLGIGDVDGDTFLDILATRSDGQLITYDFRIVGDTDRNGVFDSSDLTVVLRTSHYEDGIEKNSTFREGDWNGDREFTSSDFVFALQASTYERLSHPRIFFGKSDIPKLRDKLADPKRKSQLLQMKSRAITDLATDYSDRTLFERDKARHAQRFAFLALILELDDPMRDRFAEKAREVLANANKGRWEAFTRFPNRPATYDLSQPLHPWYTGGTLVDLSLTYDWLVGIDELSGVARQDARFNILRLAQMEHTQQSTPYDTFNHRKYPVRLSNYMFRSLSGVGFAALAFPNQKGFISDPYDRLPEEHKAEFDTSEVLQWVLGELFDEITTSASNRPANGLSMVDAFITPDGVVKESFYYQLDTFSLLIPFLTALDRLNGEDYISSNGPADGRILEAFNTNFKVMLPNGDRPLIGDAYAGDYYFWHELIASYTDNPGAHYSGSLTPRLGISMAYYDDSIPKAEPDYRTEFLPDSGIAVFRDKWGSDATHLMLLAQDSPVLGHDQADQASITLYAHGTPMVIEPGYGSAYYRAPDHRDGGRQDWINSALGHSTMTIDSVYTVESTPNAILWRDVITPSVAFSYSDVPDPATIENTLAGEHIDYAEAHVTYTKKQSNLVRAVVFPRHRYFILEDNMTSDESHQYGWQLQLGRSSTGSMTSSDQSYVWQTPNNQGKTVSLGIHMLDDQQRNVNVYDNGPTNRTGYYYPSNTYDHTYMLADKEAEDLKLVTLLDPYEDEADKLDVETLVEGRVWKVIHSPTSYDLILSQSESTPIQFGEIRTDAQFIVASIDRVNGREEVISLLARGGSELQVGYDQQQTFPIPDESMFHFEVPK